MRMNFHLALAAGSQATGQPFGSDPSTLQFYNFYREILIDEAVGLSETLMPLYKASPLYYCHFFFSWGDQEM